MKTGLFPFVKMWEISFQENVDFTKIHDGWELVANLASFVPVILGMVVAGRIERANGPCVCFKLQEVTIHISSECESISNYAGQSPLTGKRFFPLT